MDLIITFVPYLSYDSLCSLFELIKELLEVQKVLNFIYCAYADVLVILMRLFCNVWIIALTWLVGQ